VTLQFSEIGSTEAIEAAIGRRVLLLLNPADFAEADNCKTGLSCKGACISRLKACLAEMLPEQVRLYKGLLRRARGGDEEARSQADTIRIEQQKKKDEEQAARLAGGGTTSGPEEPSPEAQAVADSLVEMSGEAKRIATRVDSELEISDMLGSPPGWINTAVGGIITSERAKTIKMAAEAETEPRLRARIASGDLPKPFRYSVQRFASEEEVAVNEETIQFSVWPQDVNRLELAFSVNDNYEKRPLNNPENGRAVGLKARSRFGEILAGLPPGIPVQNSPIDDDDALASRVALYKLAGFGELQQDGSQYGVTAGAGSRRSVRPLTKHEYDVYIQLKGKKL
jgi:hypothetical protein